MKTKDFIPVKGTFHLQIFKVINPKTGKKILIEDYTDENRVVDLGREKLCFLLGNAAGFNWVNLVGVGENNTTPTVADTGLTNPYIKSIDSVEYPDPTSVKFIFEFDSGDANGLTIGEFGLIHADNTLFARKVRDFIEKRVDIIIQGDWIITFI
jgi:hypothetical protein